ncbi:MAG: hypothetical protein QF785_08195 [Phycisphaeraceae bacterium]|jgi:hypothetical protein|nr:hypothetical protein [Phycisphaeraceae bacterium]
MKHTIRVVLTEHDYEASMGQKPYGQDVFDEWATILEESLRTVYVDWSLLDDCVVDERQ